MQVKTSVLGDVIVASGDRLIDAPLMYNPTILCMLLREYTFLALLVVHAGWVSFSFSLSLYIYSYPPTPLLFLVPLGAVYYFLCGGCCCLQ